MNTATEFMGIHLKNPIVTSAGPWARDAASIQKLVDAGAAAVVSQTITTEANPLLRPRLFWDGDNGLFNTMLYSDLELEQWETELKKVRFGSCRFIASIWASSPSELAYLAVRAERMGADALEISISPPIGTRTLPPATAAGASRSFVEAVKMVVKIPVCVKLSYEAAISPAFLHALEDAGADGVSAVDALKGIIGIDLEKRTALMPTYGGYSGKALHPVALAAVSMIKQYSRLPLLAGGGVLDCDDALEFLMLGAEAVQIGTAVQLEGDAVIGKLVTGGEAWLAEHRLSSYDEIRGTALRSLVPFEEIEPKPKTAFLLKPCGREDCRICRNGCLYGAVSYGGGKTEIDRTLCRGCGLCAARCPDGCIRLDW